MLETSIILKNIELHVLLLLCNVNRVYSFVCDEREYSKDEIYCTVHSLIKRKIVDFVDDSGKVRAAMWIEYMIMLMANFDNVLIIDSIENEGLPRLCCYCCEDKYKDDILITRISRNDKNALKLSLIKKNMLTSFLGKKGYLPDIVNDNMDGFDMEEVILSDARKEFMGLNCSKIYDVDRVNTNNIEGILSIKNYYVNVEKENKDGTTKCIDEIDIIWMDNCYIVVGSQQSTHKKEVIYYSTESLNNRIWKGESVLA